MSAFRTRIVALYADLETAKAREQREPTTLHRAERESCEGFLQAADVEPDFLNAKDRKRAAFVAKCRLKDDERLGGCQCWRCNFTIPSAHEQAATANAAIPLAARP